MVGGAGLVACNSWPSGKSSRRLLGNDFNWKKTHRKRVSKKKKAVDDDDNND
jgi:hypothetical protein